MQRWVYFAIINNLKGISGICFKKQVKMKNGKQLQSLRPPHDIMVVVQVSIWFSERKNNFMWLIVPVEKQRWIIRQRKMCVTGVYSDFQWFYSGKPFSRNTLLALHTDPACINSRIPTWCCLLITSVTTWRVEFTCDHFGRKWHIFLKLLSVATHRFETTHMKSHSFIINYWTIMTTNER